MKETCACGSFTAKIFLTFAKPRTHTEMNHISNFPWQNPTKQTFHVKVNVHKLTFSRATESFVAKPALYMRIYLICFSAIILVSTQIPSTLFFH